MNNLFFATKVSFLNEMKLVADKTNVDWDKAMEGFVMDGRVGHSHLSVPGPDGKLGFGGSCFQKDILNLVYLSIINGLPEVAEYWHQVVKINSYQRKRFVNLIVNI